MTRRDERLASPQPEFHRVLPLPLGLNVFAVMPGGGGPSAVEGSCGHSFWGERLAPDSKAYVLASRLMASWMARVWILRPFTFLSAS